MSEIIVCESNEQILSCFEVMAQLRPHLDKNAFVSDVRRLERQKDYQLVMLCDQGTVCAVLGMYLSESLAWGRYVYVDDLVTDESSRSNQYGQQLLHWAEAVCKENGCAQLHLDSGVQRHRAHRFYLREHMDISSHHFKKRIV